LRITSGPIPAGSPIVTAMSGVFFSTAIYSSDAIAGGDGQLFESTA
jgi:hypothetical protein